MSKLEPIVTRGRLGSVKVRCPKGDLGLTVPQTADLAAWIAAVRKHIEDRHS